MVKVAILHEGKSNKSHDNELLKLLIQELALPLDEVKFIGLGTKSNFFKKGNDNYKELLLDIKRKSINKILFVVDADYKKNDSTYGGFDNTLKEIIKTRKELNIYENSDLYISCNFETKDGYLESLILSSIPKEQKECIEDFLGCSDFKSKENHKAILNQIYKSAYPKAPYNFTSKKFDILKLKLKTLFEGTE